MKGITNTFTIALFSIAIVFLLVQSAPGAGKDAFAGKWMLNVDKSKFNPPPGPDHREMTIEDVANGIKHVTDTQANFGGLNVIEYTAKFDGMDYPISGTGLDTVSLKRVDANTIERTGKVHGVPTETCTMKLSDGGKVLTLTINGSYNGTNYNSVQVYERE